MPNINFPSSPSTGQPYSFGTRTWVFNGTAWDLQTVRSNVYTRSGTAPSNPTEGDQWFDITSGIEYTWLGDGDSYAWVEVAGNGSTNTKYIGCRAYNDGTQSIPNNTPTALTFNTEEWDTNDIHDTSVNPSRFTVPSGMAGKWRFSWGVDFANNSTGVRYGHLKKNGTTNVIGSVVQLATIPTNGGDSHFHGTSTADLVAGDYIELFVLQNSGGALNSGYAIATNREFANFMEAQYLGA